MPNYCDYGMLVRGHKDNVEEFIRIIQADYNYYTNEFTHNRHFFRVFEANVEDNHIVYGLERTVKIYGYCAWSVYSCMFPGPFTYYGDTVDRNSPLHDSSKTMIYGTHILQESKRLHLDIEIFSEEPGMCFQEHYYISNGNIMQNEEYPLHEYWLDEIEEDHTTVEEYCKQHNLDVNTINKCIESGEMIYSPDKIDWDFKIDCQSKPLIKNIMILNKRNDS